MRFSLAIVLASGTMLSASLRPVSGQLSTDSAANCTKRLEAILLNQRLIARVQFPATAAGIDLTLDGKWDPKVQSRSLKDNGLGIDINDAAVVNQVKAKYNLVEIQLNGGGFGTFGDIMRTNDKQREARKNSAKASGGSRLNLRLNRPIMCDELVDAAKLATFVAPLLDAAVLQVVAAQQTMPPEWAAAAAQKKVLVGMDKATVFAILGEPKQKQVDLTADPPTEKWQFEMGLKTVVVTFKSGKVSKVDEF